MSERRKPIDRQSAFVEFKGTEASQSIEQEILSSRNDLKERRGNLKICTDKCNKIKAEIDAVKSFLDHKTQQKKQAAYHQSMAPGFNSNADGFDDSVPDEHDIIDEEELQRLKELKELKRQYRDSFK